MHKVVFIDGCRTPFLRSGTDYADLMSYQLGAFAIKGLLAKTGLDPELVDKVIMGNVISNIKTPNVARESALAAGMRACRRTVQPRRASASAADRATAPDPRTQTTGALIGRL